MKYNAGLVLEGGGMRSTYTQGVLDFFMHNDIDFKYIVGVSAGVGSAMSFISKQPKRALEQSIRGSQDKNIMGLRSLFKNGSFFDLNTIFNKLDKEMFFDYDTFFSSDTIFKIGCFNLETGDVDYFDKDDLKKGNDVAIASNSLPLISKIVEINNNKYLDGGMKDSIPLNKSLADNNKKNVIILTNAKTYRRKKESSMFYIKLFYHNYPKLIEALERRHIVYNGMLDYINEAEERKELFVIRPSLELEVSRYTKDEQVLRKAYEQGYEDAKANLKNLKEYLSDE